MEEVNRELASSAILVVTAPPGTGKSTVLPLLLEQDGKILMLEPRRLAARQVAERMASLLGERVGQTVGYRVRHESRVGKDTRIEVLTEGILTRMLIDDPTLDGVSLIIFDEIHERSLQADLALALARETQRLLRPDLRLLLMSATPSEQLASMGWKTLSCHGTMHPVKIVREEMEPHLAVARALREQDGDILVFLPGEAEIRVLQERLESSLSANSAHPIDSSEALALHLDSSAKAALRLDSSAKAAACCLDSPAEAAQHFVQSALPLTTHHLPLIKVCPLYANLPFVEQQQALAPAPDGSRKIVLATSIAETSLTIEGIRTVIDSGTCKRPVVDARTGLSHLQTVPVSLDMADQRTGRAGRLTEGTCYRLWTLATEHRMASSRQPEILEAELSSLYLSVLAWGEPHPERLPWLTPPPAGHLAAARALLEDLGAIDQQGRLTARGKQMAALPYHPRLASMLLAAQSPEDKREAEHLAELIEDRKPLPLHAGRLLVYAFPDRVVRGSQANLLPNDPLRGKAWLVAVSMDNRSGRIYSATSVEEEDLIPFAREKRVVRYDLKSQMLIAQVERRIGSTVLSTQALSNTLDLRDEACAAITEAIRKSGVSILNWSEEAQALQQRVGYLAQLHPELLLPDLSHEAVFRVADEWLPLFLPSPFASLNKVSMEEVLLSRLSYEQQQALELLAPTHIVVPTGSRIRLDYRLGAEYPVLRVRLQECFGLTDTPTIDEGRCPVLMELLSPGFKPVQLTRDLRSFWENTYFEVRKELRRRYPKHSWPDNPLIAEPTRRVVRK